MHGSSHFAVIDVETTLGDPRVGRIMEVAIVLTDGTRELDSWSTLVNPGVPLNQFVSALTGLTSQRLSAAPPFRAVADDILQRTEGAIIVAHNARFDSTVLAAEFGRLDRRFRSATICTEQLSRQLFPNLQFHNLNSLCRHLGLKRRANHRALSDALACTAAFNTLLRSFGEERVLAARSPELPDLCSAAVQ